MRHSRGLFTEVFHDFQQNSQSFSIFFEKKTFIALSRVYFTSGGIDGPEKDQYLKASQ